MLDVSKEAVEALKPFTGDADKRKSIRVFVQGYG